MLTLDAIPDYRQVVQELFFKQRHLVEADLYEPPLTQFGRNAVDRYFNRAEVREILDLTERLAA